MAGSGTRIRPVFPDLPKPLIPVEGRPLGIHVLEALYESGVRKVVINLRDRAEQIREGLAPFLPPGVEVVYSFEETVLGTGGGIRKAWDLYRGSPLLVIRTCDILTPYEVSRGVQDHLESGDRITMVVSESGPPAEKGKIHLSPEGTIVFPGESDEKASRPVWFTGIHIVEPDVLKPGAAPLCEPYSIVDVYRELKKKGVRIRGEVTSERWLDLGTEDGYRQHREFLEACPRTIRREGERDHPEEPGSGTPSSKEEIRAGPKV